MNKQTLAWLVTAVIGIGLISGYVLATDQEGFEDGDLIKIKNQDTVYIIEEGVKRPFVNPSSYKAFGYSWYDIKTVKENDVKDFTIGPPVKTPFVLIKAEKLFVRKWPNNFSKILNTVQKDEKYELVDNSGSWYKIKGGDELLGWISSQYTLILDEEMDEFMAIKEEIKNENINEETKKEVVQKVISPKKDEEVIEKIIPTKSLTLSYLGNRKFSWKKTGIFSEGYKLVWSKNSNPTYPTRKGDTYAFYSNPEINTGNVSAFDGEGKYYVRVCEYLGGKCGIYSNQIIITLTGDKEKITEKETSESVSSLTLTSLENGKISWKINGYSKDGFKVVWSKNSLPTYPTRDGDKYHYYSETTKTTDTVDGFDGAGKYYVRVCEYLGGKCGIYSNQIEINL